MDSDEQEIRRLMEEWRRRTAEGDVEGVLALMTGDATFLTCGSKPASRADFASSARAFAGRFRIEATQDVKELHASGDLAYSWTYVSVRVTSTETGSRTERSGHALTVFRKSPDGTWRLARDANLIAPRP
jgi:uncharacterized protein (TIGR02246 family)